MFFDEMDDMDDMELIVFLDCGGALVDVGAFILDIAFSSESILFSSASEEAVTVGGGCFTVYVMGKRPISPRTLRP